jgi:hypothetical protein
MVKINDEIVMAATQAIHDLDCGPDVCDMAPLTIEGRYGSWARAAVEAAAPLIAAQVLREAADMVDRSAADVQASNPDTHRAITAWAAAVAVALRIRADLKSAP